MRSMHTEGAPRRSLSIFARAVLTVVGIALLLGFLSLGTWQVQRRAWKLDLMARVDQRVHAAPVALPAAPQWPEVDATHYEYLPVQGQGRWLHDKTLLTQALTEDGSGFWVMTPLQTTDGFAVWINRGFIPSEQRRLWQPGGLEFQREVAGASADAPQSISGLLRLSEPGGGFLRQNAPEEGRWHARDIAAMTAAAGLAQAAPYFVDAGLPGQTEAAAPGQPKPGMTVIRFHNSHLVYALTWYGLAAMVVFAAWMVVRHERRRR